MKKIIFSLMVLLASVGITNAQTISDGTYYGTASDVYMGQDVSGTYTTSTTFSNNYMTALTMSVSGHSVAIEEAPQLTYDGSKYYTASSGTGTVTVPYGGGAIYTFEITSIKLWFSNGKMVYEFVAYIDSLSMDISFTVTED